MPRSRRNRIQRSSKRSTRGRAMSRSKSKSKSKSKRGGSRMRTKTKTKTKTKRGRRTRRRMRHRGGAGEDDGICIATNEAAGGKYYANCLPYDTATCNRMSPECQWKNDGEWSAIRKALSDGNVKEAQRLIDSYYRTYIIYHCT